MKAPASLRPLLCLPLFLSAPLAHSADGTWLSSNSNGIWSDSNRWQGGTIADGSSSILTLQPPQAPGVAAVPGSLVGGYQITLDSNRILGGITLGAGTWSNPLAYRITGPGTLTFAGTSPSITTVANAAAILEIAPSVVAGNQGILFGGTGMVHWNPGTMNLTGQFIIGAANVAITRGAALGSTEIRMTGSGPRLWVAPESGGMEITNQITLGVNGSSQYGGLTWYRNSAETVTLSGNIIQAAPGFVSNFAYTSGTGQGQQRYIVSGNNSYKGITSIGGAGAVLVLAKSSTALGDATVTADVNLANAAAGLGLSGGITITGKNVNLNGAGYSGVGFDAVNWSGSLFNQQGVNTWEGEVRLGTGANPRIGVATGSRLILEGLISGSAVGGLHKSGSGVLELTHANTYTTGTTVNEGTLLVSHATALGSGTLTLQSETTLAINTGVSASIASLNLASESRLSFSLNGLSSATGVTVSGNQIGGGLYEIDILDGGGFGEGSYTLLQVTGSAAASGFTLGEMVDGYAGDLNWENGVLTLSVTSVVPEPGSIALLLGGGVLLAGARLRRKRI